MFDATREILNEGHTHKYRLLCDASPVCYRDVIRLWQHDDMSVFRWVIDDVRISNSR